MLGLAEHRVPAVSASSSCTDGELTVSSLRPGSMPIARSSAAAGTAGSPRLAEHRVQPVVGEVVEDEVDDGPRVERLAARPSPGASNLDVRRGQVDAHGVSQGETPVRVRPAAHGAGRRRRTMPDVSSARAERLVNLVLCLLSTRQFLTAERIRTIVPGYADAPNDEAFFRMFERDKTELRELGVPLETGRHSRSTPSTATGSPAGLRARRHRPGARRGGRRGARRAAVGLPGAGRRRARRAAEAARRRGRGRRGPGPRSQPRVRATEPAFGPLLAAVQAGRRSRFDYRRGGPAGELRAAHGRAVGRGVLAGPLVRGRPRPRPGRAALLPAVAHRRAGHARSARRARCAVPDGRRPARAWCARERRAAAGGRHGAGVGGRGTGRTGCAAWPRSSAAQATRAARRRGRARAAEPRHRRPLARGPRRGRRGARPAALARSGDWVARQPRTAPARDGVTRAAAVARRAADVTAGGGVSTAGSPTGCRGCCRWCPTCSPAPASRSPRRPPTSASPRGSCAGPGAAVDVRAARLRPGRPDRPVVRGRHVTVTYDAGMRRPLRLTTAEATALLVALRTLADVPGVVDTAAVRRASPRSSAAVGDAGPPAWPSPERVARGARPPTARRCSGRWPRGRALRIRYYTASPRRDLAAHGRPDAAAASSRAAATWRRGAAAPRRCGCSGSTGSSDVDGARRARGAAARGRADRHVGGPVPARAPSTGAPCSCWNPTRAGWRSTTRWTRCVPSCGRRRGSGSCMRYADPAWLVRLVLGLGGAARVVEPPELAAAVRRAGAAGAGAAMSADVHGRMRVDVAGRRVGGVGVARAGCAGDGRARRAAGQARAAAGPGAGEGRGTTSLPRGRRALRLPGGGSRPERAAPAASRPRKLARDDEKE